MFSHPFVFPEQRQHHGSTLHEIDKVLDHGRWILDDCFFYNPWWNWCLMRHSIINLFTTGEIYLAERFPILPRVYMTLAEFFLQCGTLTIKHLRQACEVCVN